MAGPLRRPPGPTTGGRGRLAPKTPSTRAIGHPKKREPMAAPARIVFCWMWCVRAGSSAVPPLGEPCPGRLDRCAAGCSTVSRGAADLATSSGSLGVTHAAVHPPVHHMSQCEETPIPPQWSAAGAQMSALSCHTPGRARWESLVAAHRCARRVELPPKLPSPIPPRPFRGLHRLPLSYGRAPANSSLPLPKEASGNSISLGPLCQTHAWGSAALAVQFTRVQSRAPATPTC